MSSPAMSSGSLAASFSRSPESKRWSSWGLAPNRHCWPRSPSARPCCRPWPTKAKCGIEISNSRAWMTDTTATKTMACLQERRWGRRACHYFYKKGTASTEQTVDIIMGHQSLIVTRSTSLAAMRRAGSRQDHLRSLRWSLPSCWDRGEGCPSPSPRFQCCTMRSMGGIFRPRGTWPRAKGTKLPLKKIISLVDRYKFMWNAYYPFAESWNGSWSSFKYITFFLFFFQWNDSKRLFLFSSKF